MAEKKNDSTEKKGVKAAKMQEQVTANKIEVKKTVRSAGRKVRELGDAAKNQAEDIREAVVAHKIEDKKKAGNAKRAIKGKAEAAKNQAEDIREAVVAHKIEDKKKVRSAKRTMKAKAEAAKNQAEDIREAVVAHKIEDKKNIRKAAGTIKSKVKSAGEKVGKSVKTPAKMRAAVKLNVVIQSQMGGSITAEEIAAKLPKGTTDVYVRIDENKLYWVKKNGETGSVEIWE